MLTYLKWLYFQAAKATTWSIIFRPLFFACSILVWLIAIWILSSLCMAATHLELSFFDFGAGLMLKWSKVRFFSFPCHQIHTILFLTFVSGLPNDCFHIDPKRLVAYIWGFRLTHLPFLLPWCDVPTWDFRYDPVAGICSTCLPGEYGEHPMHHDADVISSRR